jgi:hypothetical protein
MFGFSSSKKKPVQTPIGPGVSDVDAKYGETWYVDRYHRGAVIEFSWPPSHPSAAMVPEVAANIQTYIDRALDVIDADEKFRAEIVKQSGVFPISLHWGRDDCDFALDFGYVGWPDGVLTFYFRAGQVVGENVSD